MQDTSFVKETNVEEFITCCNQMINGKFIMADSKISKILEAIATNQRLYKFIHECIRGYNFQREYEKALNEAENGIFEANGDIKKNICFVTCLFLEVDNKRIKFYDFISKFFRSAGAGNEYAQFVKVMLIPFKEGVLTQYNISIGALDAPIKEDKDILNEQNIFYQILNQLKLLKNEVALNKKLSSRKREEINIYLVGSIEAVKIQNKKIISALITALDKEIRGEKAFKATYAKLTTLFLKLYD